MMTSSGTVRRDWFEDGVRNGDSNVAWWHPGEGSWTVDATRRAGPRGFNGEPWQLFGLLLCCVLR